MDFSAKIYQGLMKNEETMAFSRICHVDNAFWMFFHRIESCSECFPFLSHHNIKELGFCQRFFTLA